jgi:hypothetical protein
VPYITQKINGIDVLSSRSSSTIYRAMNWTEHIIRNLSSLLHTNVMNQQLRNFVWKIQDSKLFDEYVSNLISLEDAFGQQPQKYIESIHPVNWVLFANMPAANSNVSFSNYINKHVNDTYIGCSKPLFGIRTNNLVESNNNVDILNGICNGVPFDALVRWMQKQVQLITSRSINSFQWDKSGFKLTPYAQALFKNQMDQSGYYVMEVSSFFNGALFITLMITLKSARSIPRISGATVISSFSTTLFVGIYFVF